MVSQVVLLRVLIQTALRWMKLVFARVREPYVSKFKAINKHLALMEIAAHRW